MVDNHRTEILSGNRFELGQDKRWALGMKARQRIIENFSLDAVVKKYEMLYKEVITQRHEAAKNDE